MGKHGTHIGDGFGKRGHTSVTPHRAFAGVVRRDGLAHVAFETLQQSCKVKRAHPEIFFRIEQVARMV